MCRTSINKHGPRFDPCGAPSIHSNDVISVTWVPIGPGGSPLLLHSPSASIIALSAGPQRHATLYQTTSLKWHIGTQRRSCDAFSRKWKAHTAPLPNPPGHRWAGILLEHRANLIIPFSSNANSHPSGETGWLRLEY